MYIRSIINPMNYLFLRRRPATGTFKKMFTQANAAKLLMGIKALGQDHPRFWYFIHVKAVVPVPYPSQYTYLEYYLFH